MYTSVNQYLKDTYGEKVYKLSLDAGLSCPNRDGTLGTTGCIFCSEGGSGDFAQKKVGSITAQIEAAKSQIEAKTDCKKYIAYFQAYTNTYGDIKYLREIFFEAINHPQVVILSIATRCDCISDEVLDLLSELNMVKPVWIEMGLQSVHEKTLEYIECGYTLRQFEEAVDRLKKKNITVITHLILGLPGETKQEMLESVRHAVSLPIDGIKLQLLHVLKNTKLAEIYKKEPFKVFELEEYCELIVECLKLIPQNIVVHRITGDGPRSLLIAPLWSIDKKRVLNTITKLLKESEESS